jgi:hypothetical protein
MLWEDERYVRLYTRDTTNWVLAPWAAKCVLMAVMRKLDRAGTLDLGDDGMEGLAAIVTGPLDFVTDGMAYWLKRKTFEMRGSRLVMVNFLEAQEASASDKKRAREHRERSRDLDRLDVTIREDTVTHRDDIVPQRDEPSREQTNGHAASHAVTLCCAVPPVPSRAVPPVPEREGVASSAKRATVKATRLTEDWRPSPKTVDRFQSEGIDAMGSLENFQLYWLPKVRDATKLDWDKTFIAWVKRDVDSGKAKKIESGTGVMFETTGGVRRLAQ